jgi:SPP1 family predicted phage head-tail adaptor
LNRRIKLHVRTITPPKTSGTDFTEEFVSTKEVWAKIKTSSGKVFFADTQTDVSLTHEMYIRFNVTVTSETWIEYEGSYFDIVAVEDLEERHEFMHLRCVERGAKTVDAAHV